MRVLVTGGAGFIGSHLVEELLSDGHGVAILDGRNAADVGVLPLERERNERSATHERGQRRRRESGTGVVSGQQELGVCELRDRAEGAVVAGLVKLKPALDVLRRPVPRRSWKFQPYRPKLSTRTQTQTLVILSLSDKDRRRIST